MPSPDEGRAVLNPMRLTDSQKDTRSFGAVRRDKSRLATSPNMSGGVGPVRSTRSYAHVSADADLKTVRFSLWSRPFPSNS